MHFVLFECIRDRLVPLLNYAKNGRIFLAKVRAMKSCRNFLQRVLCGNQTVPNAPKWYNTHHNVSLGSNGLDRVCSLRKILTPLRGTNFCTSLAHFAPNSVRQPNGPKCTQLVRNAPKRQFRIQWSRLGAFLEKNSDATSWHELLH